MEERKKRWQDILNVFHQVAAEGMKRYDAVSPEATLELLDYSENATYISTHPKTSEKYILRISRPNYHKKVEIESEINWLETIHTLPKVFNVAKPVKGKNGEAIQSIILPHHDAEYYCTLFTYLEGERLDEGNEEALIEQFERLGEITAYLHKHSIDHHEAWMQKKRLTWDVESILGKYPKWGRWQDGKGITPEREKLFSEVSLTIQKRLEAFGKSKERFGLIHADLRLANLLISQNQISVIDFDDCGFGWYLFDLGASLSFIEHYDYIPDLINAWLKGYRKVRKCSQAEEKEIPTFIMMRRLQLIAWIGSRDNETTAAHGEQFTVDTDALALAYLEKMKE